MTTIESLLFSVDSAICLDVSRTVIRYFKLCSEKWCFQSSITIKVRTVSAAFWIICIGPCLLSARPWTLRPLRNNLLPPWSYQSMTCMLVSWSVCGVGHVLGDRPLILDLLSLFLGLLLLNLIYLWFCDLGRLLCHRPSHCLLRLVGTFPFLESLLFPL